MKADAVFEGGGVKGIAFVGAIEVMEARGYTWNKIAGTSAGAIVATLLACGYNSAEIRNLMSSLDYTKLLGRTGISRLPLFNKTLPFIFDSGIYSNHILEQVMTDWLKRKNIVTFGDLPEGKLSIIASNISNGKIVVFPNDLPHYGLKASEFPIAAAVRMSTTLPFFFKPYLWHTPLQKKPYYMLDGGMLSNFPIWLFDVEGIPQWPTFGFRLSEKRTYAQSMDINGPVSLLKGIFKTMLQAHDQRHVDEHTEERTMFIPTGKVTTTKFNLTEEDQRFLLQSGHVTATKFLESWNFETYKNKFRQNHAITPMELYFAEQQEGHKIYQ
ncbi:MULTISPECIES: patatin-like phospholipase family protein [Paenibacillus]|uniref:Patatin-like phospholipase family protein n=2 Tax=Paenibacillus TaxID=44249 RepID=A0ABD8AKP4_PAEAM|nr:MULTISPECIES: patatin-like phospholipase family protein [Paenibacillus]ETT47845.1 phospholipase [Paenibacillus sp. FSL H7-689]KLU54973.1 phospholipase [Paenibacillus sp. VT-400]OMF01600.1 phospholipase [Paenibacillus amylolyticus]